MEDTSSGVKRKKRKIFLLIFLMFITTIVLVVSTYAWFVGTGSVNVSTFTLDIGVADGLELSLDGEHWTDTTLTIGENEILGNSGTLKAYSGNKNIWPTDGLMPVSSNGDTDTTNGRMFLYQMGAITATNGGFRFIAKKINNATDEKAGYLAFDLFIKNGEGEDYITTYNQLDDEAIYLTRNSKAVFTAGGSVTEDHGIANSLRVAFMQVGRVKWNTTPASKITGINCSEPAANADPSTYPNTGLCSVDTTIWEPNNRSHNSNLISYFNMVCKNRTDIDTYTTTQCTTFDADDDVDTYVVTQEIDSETKTDIYDGHNGYTNAKLNNLNTFTDDMKNSSGQTRDPFMFLAANSITKLRIYVYIEGQDVDNNDMISHGKITINFGFTKDIFSEETIDTPIPSPTPSS